MHICIPLIVFSFSPLVVVAKLFHNSFYIVCKIWVPVGADLLGAVEFALGAASYGIGAN